MKQRFFIAAVICMIMCTPALAGSPQKAKEHFLKGKQLVEVGAHDKAIIELKKSYELNPVPIVLYNVAMCYQEIQKYANAVKYYSLFLEKAKNLDEYMKEEVLDRIKSLEKFVGLLKVVVDEEDAEVLVDDELVGYTPIGSISVETGEHELVIRKTGFLDIKRKVTVVSGEISEVWFSMQKTGQGKAPESAHAYIQKEVKIEKKGKTVKEKNELPVETLVKKKDKKKREKKIAHTSYFYSMIGITGGLTLAAIITGALAVRKDNEAALMYMSTKEYEDVRDEGKRLALATDVMIGFATAAAIVSLILFFNTNLVKGKKRKKTDALVGASIEGGSVVVGF